MAERVNQLRRALTGLKTTISRIDNSDVEVGIRIYLGQIRGTLFGKILPLFGRNICIKKKSGYVILPMNFYINVFAYITCLIILGLRVFLVIGNVRYIEDYNVIQNVVPRSIDSLP